MPLNPYQPPNIVSEDGPAAPRKPTAPNIAARLLIGVPIFALSIAAGGISGAIAGDLVRANAGYVRFAWFIAIWILACGLATVFGLKHLFRTIDI